MCKLKTILLTIVGSLLLSSAIEAQATLKGVVKDSTTNEAAIGAIVYSLNDKSHGTVSDINGNYQLNLLPGRDTVVCSMIGMQADTIVISGEKNAEHNFLLSSGVQQMATMVVSAGRYERKLEDITVSMEVMKPSLIENKNSSNITDALEQVPGLDILDGEPQIRGGSGFNFGVGSRVAILIDGLPALAGDGGALEWSFIPIENVEQVEVIKGASSVTYGSSALSGSINIRTAYAKDKPVTIISGSSGLYDAPSVAGTKWWDGMANFSTVSFMHAQRFGQLDLVIGGMAKYDHGYIGPPTYNKNLPKVDNDTTLNNNDVGEKTGRFNFNLRYKPKNTPQINYGINGNFMQSDNTRTLIWQDDTLGLYRAFPHTLTQLHQKMFYIDPFINYNSDNRWIQSFRTRYSYTNNLATNEDVTTNTATPNILTITNVIYSEYQVVKQVNEDLNFTGGLVMNQTYSYNGISFPGVLNTNHLQNFAGFLQVDKKFWKRLNLSVGFREESFAMNNGKTTLQPVLRAGANVKVAKRTYVRASIGQGYRFPSITEKYIYSNIGGVDIFPNPNLQAETSVNEEIGVKQEFKINKFTGAIDVAAFQQYYDNTIEITYGGWNTYYQFGNEYVQEGFKYLNTGQTRVKGLEISLPGYGEITKDLAIEVTSDITYIVPQAMQPNLVFATDSNQRGMTYTNSSTNTKNNILKYRFQTLAKVDLELTYKKYSIGGDWRYYSVMQNIDTLFYVYDAVAHYGIVNYRQTHDAPINVFDARVAVQVSKVIKAAFVVNNVTNLSYSLRPMKIEAPRTFAIRVTYRVD